MAKSTTVFKFPKTPGLCADLLHEIKERRRAAEAVAKKIDAEEKALIDHIIEIVPKGESGASGKHHKVSVYTEEVPTAEDWDKIHAYIIKNKAWDLIQRRLSGPAVAARWDAGKTVTGIKKFNVVKVSLTKI